MNDHAFRHASWALALLIATSDGSQGSFENIHKVRLSRSVAACDGSGDDREIVGQIPDIVLTTGVPENRTVTHRHVVFPAHPLVPNGYLPYSECGAIARSMTPGLSIKSTYFDFDVVHPTGEWAGLNGSHGAHGEPRVLSPIGLELIFDGSPPAGTVGRVEIAQNIGGDGIGFIPRIIGNINVYVVAPNAPLPVTWFTVSNNTGSIAGSRIILDHPLLNGNPGNRIFVTHSYTPPGAANGMAWPHPVSVSYDTGLLRWTIRNDDNIPMPEGIGFNVRIDPSAKILTVRRRAVSSGNTVSSLTINDSRANYNPYATIFVTPASSSTHPTAVKYVAPYWRIVNSDGAPLRAGQRFFVQIFGATAYRDDRWRGSRQYNPLGTNTLSNGVGIDIDGLGAARTDGTRRHLDFFWAKGSSLPLILTANQNPLGRDPFVDANYSGVSFSGAVAPVNTWSIRHENGSAMANNSSFNLWAPAYIPRRPPLDSILDPNRTRRLQ